MMYNKKDLTNEINKILLYHNIILLIIKIRVVSIQKTKFEQDIKNTNLFYVDCHDKNVFLD